MTIRLYDKDVDMLDFSAVVKTCAQRENGYVVTLDQTAFFPEGGGQGADHGTLGGVQVLDAHDVHGEVAPGQRAADNRQRGARPCGRGAQAGHDAAAQRRAHVFRIGARPFRV